MIIQHNLSAMFLERQMGIIAINIGNTTEKLSSGYKVNRAADDAAGLSISEKMRAQIRGLYRGSENVQEGISFCNVAEGALNEVHSILQRIRELSVQAANDTYVSADRKAINDEIGVLKEEINRISVQTEYNTYSIFASEFKIDFSDDVNVIEIFNASTGNYPVDPADPNSYGGIIVKGVSGEDIRVSWDKIDPKMVSKDSNTNEVKFHAGTYTYDTGVCELTFECEEGSKPPEIKVSFPVKGTEDGIIVAGKLIEWKDILNEKGDTILNHIGEGGFYHFRAGNGQGVFFANGFKSLSDIYNGINATNDRYGRKYVNEYSGYYTAQAVDVSDTGSKMKVTNNLLPTLKNHDDLDIRLKADDTGIWIVKINSDGTDGAMLAGSKMAWTDAGIDINSWDSGSDISEDKKYKYTYNKDEYEIEFDFTLLKQTGLDSVIAGINNARISDINTVTKDGLELNFKQGNGVISGTMKNSKTYLTLYDEADLGRDFNKQTQQLGSTVLSYDEDKNTFSLEYKDSNGNVVVKSNSTSVTSLNGIRNNMSAYEEYLVQRRIHSLLTNTNPPTLDNLGDVLGASNIVDSYKLDMSTLTANAQSTQSLTGTFEGVSYMDFSGLGKKNGFDLYDLLGTGFNSTCSTCSNHYSVQFVYEDSSTAYKSEKSGYNTNLKINLKKMAEDGINDGKKFTEELIKIMEESKFDFHFQQYVADDGKLYVVDNRKSSLGSFDPAAYNTSNVEINVTMGGSDMSMNLSYLYDITSDLSQYAKIVEDNNGEFVKDNDGKLVLYSSGQAGSGAQRYTIKINPTDSGDSWESVYDNIMKNIANQSTVNLSATDYAYVNYRANENINEAVVSTFDFNIEDNKIFWIQGGANTGQGINLEWDGFSTYTLGIGDGNTLTRTASEELIYNTDKAIETISHLRNKFGAYTNRLEHFYDNDTNTAENLQEAESKIRDADMADEMVALAISNIIEQAGISLLSQANNQSQGILQLLG